MLYNDINLEYGPIEFGLVQSKTEPWLASSIDRFVVLQSLNTEDTNAVFTPSISW